MTFYQSAFGPDSQGFVCDAEFFCDFFRCQHSLFPESYIQAFEGIMPTDVLDDWGVESFSRAGFKTTLVENVRYLAVRVLIEKFFYLRHNLVAF